MKKNISVINLTGTIGKEKNSLSHENLENVIKKAFSQRNLIAVALKVNSPGGSPVQSDIISGRIRSLSKKKNIPVYAFCEDVAASGGYWLACAADYIYAMPSSIIGSIGVISSSFGFSELIKNYGIERRVYTSGESKSKLDPFQPEDKNEVEKLKQIQSKIHEDFKKYVKQRRKDKLVLNNENIFAGDFWTAEDAIELGLIDGIGDLYTMLEYNFKDARIKEFSQKKSFFQKLKSGDTMIEDFSDSIISSVENKIKWQQFGL